MTKEKTVTISVRIPEWIIDQIEEISKKSGSTVTTTIRHLFERELFLYKEKQNGNKIPLEDQTVKRRKLVR